MQRQFADSFSSTDDPELDAELIALEDEKHTIEQIQELCRRYRVRARVFEGQRVIGEVAPDGSNGSSRKR